MKSYYFSFESTGIAEIDAILTAVAKAGRTSHHTDGWADEYGEGERPVGWIQDAAKAAAAEILRLRAELGDTLALLGRGVELFEGDDLEVKRLRRVLDEIGVAIAGLEATGAPPGCEDRWNRGYGCAARDCLRAVAKIRDVALERRSEAPPIGGKP